MSSSSRRGQAWLTPVEIFAPWYSYAVARYILDDFRRRGAGGHLTGGEVTLTPALFV